MAAASASKPLDPCRRSTIPLRTRPKSSSFLRLSAPAAYRASVAARVKIDDIDRQILDLLTENARRTIADIAARVSLSPAPVKRRVDRLEEAGVIGGYTVRVDHAKIGPSIDAFTELRFAGDADVDETVAAVRQLAEVREIFTTAGDPDALVRIRVDDVAHLKRVVNALRQSGRIAGTKTLMVLDHWSRTTT
jgi:Lrp/AsnC family transcriptional regulator, leucine-responsive regulatory protein